MTGAKRKYPTGFKRVFTREELVASTPAARTRVGAWLARLETERIRRVIFLIEELLARRAHLMTAEQREACRRDMSRAESMNRMFTKRVKNACRRED